MRRRKALWEGEIFEIFGRGNGIFEVAEPVTLQCMSASYNLCSNLTKLEAHARQVSGCSPIPNGDAPLHLFVRRLSWNIIIRGKKKGKYEDENVGHVFVFRISDVGVTLIQSTRPGMGNYSLRIELYMVGWCDIYLNMSPLRSSDLGLIGVTQIFHTFFLPRQICWHL
jgi:hypothetical protein